MKALSAVIGVIALSVLAVSTIPLSAAASQADYYFFLGTWTYSESDDNGTIEVEVSFKYDGTYTTTMTGTYGEETDTEESSGEWKVEDGKIFLKDEDAEDWDEGTEYSFSNGYTELNIMDGSREMTFEKKASYFGVCCPWCFMGFVPAFALLAGIVILRKKNVTG